MKRSQKKPRTADHLFRHTAGVVYRRMSSSVIGLFPFVPSGFQWLPQHRMPNGYEPWGGSSMDFHKRPTWNLRRPCSAFHMEV